MKEYVIVPPSIEGTDMEKTYLEQQHCKFCEYFVYYDSIPGGKKLKAQDARSVLPQYTRVNNLTVSANPRSWMHIRCMRGAADAQWEVRNLSDLMWEKFSHRYPITAELFEEEQVSQRKHRLSP